MQNTRWIAYPYPLSFNLAEPLCDRTAARGQMILSGVLTPQADGLADWFVQTMARVRAKTDVRSIAIPSQDDPEWTGIAIEPCSV